MLEPAALAVVASAVALGAALNALSGFGFALVTVPIMAVAIGPKEAVVVSAVVGLFSNGGVAIRHRRDAVRPVAGRVLAGSFVGMPLGLLVLEVVGEDPLKVAIAVVVLCSAVVLAAGWRLRNPRPATDVGAGFLSGLLNTSVGISGPPVVMLLQGRGLAKAPFRATSVMVFWIAGAVAVVLFGLGGQFSTEVVTAALVALPALPVGWVVGDRLHHRFDEARFRGLVLVMMTITALVALVSALA